MSDLALGLDLGTGSVRAVVVACDGGAERAAAVVPYAHGEAGVIGDPREPEVARQHPGDYREAVVAAVREVTAEVDPGRIVGIGVDTTASTPLPIDGRGRPLTDDPRFAGRLAAMAWLWKDHSAHAEADEITAAARAARPEFLQRCGGTYSSEWFWSKALRCLRTDPEVFAAAATFVEVCDYVPAMLCGLREPAAIRRGICAAGHKGLFAADWGGYPDEAFLAAIDPRLVALRRSLPGEAATVDRPAGKVAPEIAAATGLRAETPVAIGAIDAHVGALGAGIRPGDLVKVVGTSTCDLAVVDGDRLPDVTGLCGVVPGSILPGLFGIEAGQPAVGDAFAWCARLLGRRLDELEVEAARVGAGASGLLALDWLNGNRSVLVDPELSGAVIGLGLHTSGGELYRAVIEASAFGARVIVERMRQAGVSIERVIACGGIARKSPLVMQVLADVLGTEVLVSPVDETCALGAAICGAVAAGRFADVEAGQRAMCCGDGSRHVPEPTSAARYDELYALYRRLHDSFGNARRHDALGDVMKALLRIRRQARREQELQ